MTVLKVSPSRIGTYADCGQQYKFKYIDKISPEREGSAALFGKVMHRARQDWVLDRSLDLIDLTRKAWITETAHDPVVAQFIQAYTDLSGKAIRLEEEIRRRRPELKVVRMSKDWKTSTIAKQIERLIVDWLPRLERSRFEFKERDPLPSLYDESLVLAWKYGERYRTLPNSYYTELAFDFEWEGFQLNGFIDEIAPLIDRTTGEDVGIGVIDAKTYRVDPDHEFKDWRQGVIYTIALDWLVTNGLIELPGGKPVWFGVDRMRLLDFKWFQFDDSDIRRLLAELRVYQRGVENEVFLPASKTCKADFCDFKDQCAFFHGNAAKPVELNVA